MGEVKMLKSLNLMKNIQELGWKEEKKPSKQHRFNMRY